jgi:malate/lactate dehydrogenase
VQNEHECKKIVINFLVVDFCFFWAFKKIKPIDVKKKSTSKGKSEASADGSSDEQMKNARVCLKAYSEAKKAGESRDFLAEMNREFQKEYGLKVMPNKTNGKPFRFRCGW